MFLLIQDLKKINNMYRFSLDYFVGLFKSTLVEKGYSDNITKKLQQAVINLFKICFQSVGQSLFKKDRLSFGLHMVTQIKKDLFAKNEWEFFLETIVANITSNVRLPGWCP